MAIPVMKFQVKGSIFFTISTIFIIGTFYISYAYRVSGHNGPLFDGNVPSLGEQCVKTEVM